MKKSVFRALSLVLILALLIPGLSLIANAAGKNVFKFTGEDDHELTYRILSKTDKTVEVYDGKSAAGDVVIPEKVTDSDGVEYTVVRIGKKAFDEYGGDWSNKILTHITIPGTVKSIGKYAFRYGWSLGITFSEGLEVIEEGAFYNCSAFGELELPSTVTTIGDEAFYQCFSIPSIVLPASLTSIGINAFTECKILKNLTIDESNTTFKTIDGVLFRYTDEGLELAAYPPYKDEEEYTIPDGTTSIGPYAFYDNANLKKIEMPDSVTSIGEYAFCSSDKLSECKIGKNVSSIGEGAFRSIYEISAYSVDENNTTFKSIDGVLFKNTEDGLELVLYPVYNVNTHYSIPENTKSIGPEAFSGSNYLEELDIPSTLTKIGEKALYKCYKMKSFTVDQNNTVFKSVEGVLFKITEAGLELVAYPMERDGEDYDIPDGTISIWPYAFYYSDLDKIQFPDGLTSIGDFAFEYCSDLLEIQLPDSVTSIGDRAFAGCYDIEKVKLSKGLTSIGYNPFYDCDDLISFSIDESNELLKLIDGVLFKNTEEGPELVSYPIGIEAEEYEIPEGTTVIGPYAFYYASDLKKIVIPSSVTVIKEGAFSYCYDMTDLTINGNDLIIEDEAFADCDDLVNVTIPGTVKSIGSYCFGDCYYLRNLIILPGVGSIAEDVVEDCNNVTVYLPAYLEIEYLEDAVVEVYYPLSGENTEQQHKIIVAPGKYTDLFDNNEFYFYGDDDPVNFSVVPALQEGENVSDLFVTEGLDITDNGDGTYTFIMPQSGAVAKTEVGFEQTSSVTIDGWKFGEGANEPQLTEGSNPGGGEVTYKYYTDEDCLTETTSADGAAEDGAVPSKAGTYYVKATVAAAGNYVSSESVAEFTIAKGTAPAASDITSEQIYTVTTINGSVAITVPEDAGNVSYTVGEPVTTGIVTVSDVTIDRTTGVITATLSGGEPGDTITIPVTVSSDNYEDFTVNAVITLDDRSEAGVSVADEEVDSTFGSDGFKIEAAVNDAGEGEGVWTWTSSNNEVATVDGEGNVTILSSGEAEITATYTSDTTTGSVTVKINVAGKDISEAEVAVNGSYEYDATEKIPDEADITVTLDGVVLVNGVDYTLEFSDNTEAGQATVTVTGMGNYQGTALGSFVIEEPETTEEETGPVESPETGEGGLMLGVVIALAGAASVAAALTVAKKKYNK